MGLRYGQPKYVQTIYDHCSISSRTDVPSQHGLFNYCTGLTMTNERFHALFKVPPCPPNPPAPEVDLARSTQDVTKT